MDDSAVDDVTSQRRIGVASSTTEVKRLGEEQRDECRAKDLTTILVRIAKTEPLGYSTGTKLQVPCEINQTLELWQEVYRNDDDGEILDTAAVHGGILWELKFMECVVQRSDGCVTAGNVVVSEEIRCEAFQTLPQCWWPGQQVVWRR